MIFHTPHKRRIHFSASLIKEAFSSADINTVTQTMAGQQSKRNVWKSTKTDGELHGYGMKNIDKTVKAYGGYCSRTIENGIFSCHIRMQNRADIEPFVPLGERK